MRAHRVLRSTAAVMVASILSIYGGGNEEETVEAGNYSFRYALPASNPFILEVSAETNLLAAYGKKRVGDDSARGRPLQGDMKYSGKYRLIVDTLDTEGNYPATLTWLGGTGTMAGGVGRSTHNMPIPGLEGMAGHRWMATLSPNGEWISLPESSGDQSSRMIESLAQPPLALLLMPQTDFALGEAADCTEYFQALTRAMSAQPHLIPTGPFDLDGECSITLAQVDHGIARLEFNGSGKYKNRWTVKGSEMFVISEGDIEYAGSTTFDLQSNRLARARIESTYHGKSVTSKGAGSKKDVVVEVPRTRVVYQIVLHEE